MDISERELARFLETIKQQELRTWERPRTTDELTGFVLRKLAEIDPGDAL